MYYQKIRAKYVLSRTVADFSIKCFFFCIVASNLDFVFLLKNTSNKKLDYFLESKLLLSIFSLKIFGFVPYPLAQGLIS